MAQITVRESVDDYQARVYRDVNDRLSNVDYLLESLAEHVAASDVASNRFKAARMVVQASKKLQAARTRLQILIHEVRLSVPPMKKKSV